MFKRSFNNFIQDEKVTDDLPLVGALSFNKLSEPVKEMDTTSPIACKNCGCVLLDKTRLVKTGKGYEFTCEFCMTQNTVPEEVVLPYLKILPELEEKEMSGKELGILLEAIRKGEEPALAATKKAGDLFLACIDISGSMAGGKIEAVKHSLVQTVRDLKVNQPQTQFALVTFESNIEIIPYPGAVETIGDGDIMHSKDQLATKVSKLVKKKAPKSLGEFGDKWISMIQNLQDRSMTALGPAMWASYTMAKNLPVTGSKITLLTDGLANVGMGRIENISEKESRKFYGELAKDCLGAGIIVDVIGVQESGGGNQVALNIVGILSDITGGEMFFISSEEIDSAFGSIRGRQYVARDTVIRVYTPPEVELGDITGVYLQDDIPKQSGAPINLGALDANREVYLKFQPKGKLKAKKVPVQIQMEYRDQDGAKRMRVIRQDVEVTDDETTFKKGYNAKIMSNLVLQEASQSYSRSDVGAAKGLVSKFKKKFKAMADAAAGGAGVEIEGLDEGLSLFEDEEEEWDAMEKEVADSKVADDKSFRAAKAQSMYRMSADDRMKRMKSKKK